MNLKDIESEQRVLSSMMHSEKSCADALLTLEEKDFTDGFNQKNLLTYQEFIHQFNPADIGGNHETWTANRTY